MTYIIMKLQAAFPRSNKKVCTLSRLYRGSGFLTKTYGLQPGDRIRVTHMRRAIGYRKWKASSISTAYRTPFKTVFVGTLADFETFCRAHLQKTKEARRTDDGTHERCGMAGAANH